MGTNQAEVTLPSSFAPEFAFDRVTLTTQRWDHRIRLFWAIAIGTSLALMALSVPLVWVPFSSWTGGLLFGAAVVAVLGVAASMSALAALPFATGERTLVISDRGLSGTAVGDALAWGSIEAVSTDSTERCLRIRHNDAVAVVDLQGFGDSHIELLRSVLSRLAEDAGSPGAPDTLRDLLARQSQR